MADVIRIRLMESFAVLVNGENADEQVRRSRKGAALVQYLILHECQVVPNHRLLDALWPEESSSNPESALKTLVSRVRGLLNRVSPGLGGCIVAEGGGYRWECLPGVSVDLYEIQEILYRLERGVEGEVRRVLWNRLMDLYRGDLLQSGDTREWIQAHATLLHNRFLTAANEYVKQLAAEKDLESVAETCRRVLAVDSFDDRFHIELMNALIRMGRMNEALKHYRHVKNLHYRYLGMQPSEDLQAFYRKIVRTGQAKELDMKAVRSELLKEVHPKEPIVCDYSIFRDLCRLMISGGGPRESAMLLAAVTLDSAEEVPLEAARLDNAMTQLLTVLKEDLRWGDLITRFSPGMYVMLLPSVRSEPVSLTMERIKQHFARRYSHGDLVLSHQVDLLDDQ